MRKMESFNRHAFRIIGIVVVLTVSSLFLSACTDEPSPLPGETSPVEIEEEMTTGTQVTPDKTPTVSVTEPAVEPTPENEPSSTTEVEPTPTTETSPEVEFIVDSQRINEDANSISVSLRLSRATDEEVVVPFCIGGSASVGEDYDVSASPVIIAAGVTTAEITFTIFDDDREEPDETIVISMDTPSNAAKGSISSHTATILASDIRETITWDGYTVTSEESFERVKIVCAGDIVIRRGGSLVLDYVALTMVYDGGEGHGIYVEAGGELKIVNDSLIASSDNESGYYEFWYKEGSSGEISGATIRHTWTPDPGGNSQFNEAGMFIEADNFIIDDSVIEWSRGNGVEAYRAHSFIAKDSSICKNGANGLLIRNSENINISGCQLSGNGIDKGRIDGCGLIMIVVDGLLSGNFIENNRYTGVEGSGEYDLTVSGNTARNNGDFGIFFHDEFSVSTVEIYGNTCEFNGMDSMHPGLSIENSVRAEVYDNVFNKNYMGIRVLSNHFSLVFHHNVVNDNVSAGIHVDNANPVFYANTVTGNEIAVLVQDNNGLPDPDFGDEGISDSGWNDFSNNDIGIRNFSSVDIKAENNYWGLFTESEIESYNDIGESSGVIYFAPWLSAPPETN